ncbi:class I SAM-dependent methyltransferase [Actinoplanes utahensis]|uniref:class I SAM-dependent methyltransferase n=1 Tax=Actinoplanes utahensis TaxID=1869 RepID=UPI00068CF1A4|nr:methyltransferase domain-containing protein [Actinoplanes utahensis]GIF30788.1 methyltransferase type 11 [Actinoplanes utahensis]
MELFGTVADLYETARPGYPPQIADAILSYHGRTPSSVVEIGAGTGKATAVLAGIGAPLTCVEPDARMAAVLASRFPVAVVERNTFEHWSPPAGGAEVLACAMAWHWLDPATRNTRARGILAPGGTLAVFGHRYEYADPAHGAAIQAAVRAVDPGVRERPADWFHDDIVAAGCFTGVRKQVFENVLPLDRSAYLALVQTFGPFLQRSPEQQERGLDALGTLIDDFGGTVVLNLRTTLVLARR